VITIPVFNVYPSTRSAEAPASVVLFTLVSPS